MEKQLHLGSVAPEQVYFKPAINQEYDFNMKPGYGLWTSSWNGTGSEWTQWCVAEDFLDPYAERWFLLTPPSTARIYTIDGLDDLLHLLREYHREPAETARHWQPMGWINWVEVSLHYDAVHLTSRGNKLLHHHRVADLNCWDVESTVWLNWVDFAVEEVAVPQIALKEQVG